MAGASVISRALNALKRWLREGDDVLGDELMSALDPKAPGEGELTRPAVPDAPKRVGLSLRRRLMRWGLYRAAYALAAVVMCAALIAALMLTVMDMPYFGAADTLVDSEVANFYIERTKDDTGAKNVISGIILSYRGFDTLGEAHVLFIAVLSVLILLKLHPDDSAPLPAYDYAYADDAQEDEILTCAAKYLTPLVLLFGMYVTLNGNISPGGGFSGGAVMGAGLILYLSAFGYARARRLFTYSTFKAVSCASLITYALLKGYHFITGANGFESRVPKGVYGLIFSGGLMLPLNLCVALVVACTMYALFTMFNRGDF